MSNSANALVTIPHCTASQLLGSVEKELGNGELLAIADPASPQTVLLQVGHAAFALQDKAHFYTHADDERLYFFGADHLGSGSYVKIQLPEDVVQAGSATQKQRDKFEDALMARGFLRAGAFAAADEVGRSIAQDGKTNAAALANSARQYISTSSPGRVEVPASVKESTAAAKETSSDVANYTSDMAGNVAGVVRDAGSRVGESLPSMDVGEDSALSSASESAKGGYAKVAEGASAISEGVKSGARELGAAASQAAHDVIEHSYGDEASKTASDAAEASRNTGSVLANASMNTSGIYHGSQFGSGAYKGASGSSAS